MRLGNRLAAQALAGAFAIMMLAAFLLHAPCRNSGYTDSRFTAMCYSDFAALLSTPPLNEGGWPFVSGQPSDEAPGLALVGWVSAQVPGGFATHVIVLQILVALAFAAAAAAVFTLRTFRRQDALLWVLLPVWPFLIFINGDVFAIAFASWALVLWERQRPLIAGLLAAAALAFGSWTWLLLLAFAVQSVRESRIAAAVYASAVALGGALLLNLPRILSGQSLLSQVDWISSEGSPSFTMNFVAGSQAGSGVWILLAGLAAQLAIAVWATRLPFDFRTEALLGVLVSVQLLTGLGIQPQNLVHLVWLVPLVWPHRSYAIAVCLPLVAYVMAVWLRFEAAAENGKGVHEATYGLLALGMWIAVGSFFVLSRKVMVVQGADIVEISREATLV